MRLFIGIELSGTAQEEILGIRERLVETITRQGVRFVRPEKLHLTLAFLGQVEVSDLDGLIRAIDQLGPTQAGIHLRVTGLGCFPDARRPKVIWVGVEGDVQNLATQVVEAAKPFALELDEKPFSAHITLARISPGSKEVGRAIGHIALEPTVGEFTATEFCLCHSKQDGTYEVLHRVRLKTAAFADE